MDYERRGGRPYGRNRQLTAPSTFLNRADSYAVVRCPNDEFVERFPTHEEACAERSRLEAETPHEYAIRKL